MKHLTNFTVGLCFCMVPLVHAQDDAHLIVRGSRYMEASLTSAVTGTEAYQDSLGQSFYHFGGALHSIRPTVIEPFSLTDVEGTLTVYAGDVYGQIVAVESIMIPGLNRFFSFSAAELDTLSESDVIVKANQVFASTIAGEYPFELVSTEYLIDMELDAGTYAFVVQTDRNDVHDYGGGGSHAPQINCFTNMSTYDPYPLGHAINGGGIGEGGSMLMEQFVNFMDPADMAFEYASEDLSTDVAGVPETLAVSVDSFGALVIPNEWLHGRLLISDASGRSVFSCEDVRNEHRVLLEKGRLYIVRFEKDGLVKSAKFVPL